MKHLTNGLLLLAVIAIIAPARAWAQQINTTIDPSFYHIITKPDTTYTLDFSFKNNGDPQLYQLKEYELGNPDTEGNLYPLKKKVTPVDFTIDKALQSFGEQFLLRSSQNSKVPVKISIPAELEDGEYYFAIAAETVAAQNTQGGASISLNSSNAVLIIITITRDNSDKKDIKTDLFSVISPISLPFGNNKIHLINSSSPIPLSLLVKNGGKYIVMPHGHIAINSGKKEVYSSTITPVYIYPYSQRRLTTADFSKEKCLNKYTYELCKNNYSLIIPALPIGFYTIVSSISYGDPSPIIYDSQYVLVIPYVGTILIIFLLALPILMIVYKHSKGNKHTYRKK